MATLIDTTTTVTEAPRRKFRLSKADHIAEVSLLSSSPISSYDIQDSTTVVVKHRQTLEETIKSTKQKLNARDELLDEVWQSISRERQENATSFQKFEAKFEAKLAKMQAKMEEKFLDVDTRLRILEVERQYEKDVLLDWETKTRLAQRPFHHISILSQICLLKAQSCAYLPYLLSMWAVFHGRYPASRFRPNLSSEEADAYDGKALNLLTKDLGDSVEAVWNSIPELDRNFMVSVYLSRPAERKVVVHLKPTINEAMQVLASDQRLSQVEKDTAADYIPRLVDRREVPLFNPWYVSGT